MVGVSLKSTNLQFKLCELTQILFGWWMDVGGTGGDCLDANHISDNAENTCFLRNYAYLSYQILIELVAT